MSFWLFTPKQHILSALFNFNSYVTGNVIHSRIITSFLKFTKAVKKKISWKMVISVWVSGGSFRGFLLWYSSEHSQGSSSEKTRIWFISPRQNNPPGLSPQTSKRCSKKKKRDPKRLPPEQTLNLTKSLRQR